jgi:hypothetical protein
MAIVNKALDEIKAELPEKPPAELPDDVDIDLSHNACYYGFDSKPGITPPDRDSAPGTKRYKQAY